MVALAIFGFLFACLIHFVVIRISISAIYWSLSDPKDKAWAFRIYFPYYIIILFGICIAFIIKSDLDPFAIFYFSMLYTTALIVWNRDLKKDLKRKHTIKKYNNPDIKNLP